MKEFISIIPENICTYYVGTTEEVKSLYKSINRACKNGNTNIFPLFTDSPKFSNSKTMYALSITETINGSKMQIINSDIMLNILMSGEVEERRN